MKNKFTLIGLILVFGFCSFYLTNCSKERINAKPLNDYASLKDYLNSKKQQEQEIIIDTNGHCPLTGKYGTKICPTKTDLKYPNKADSIYFPFTVKLIELYTAKDMIYYQMPTVSDGNVLSTNGELRIRAYKGTTELVLRPSRTWSVTMPAKTTVSDMKQYYGSMNDSLVAWVTNPVGSFSKTDSGYYAEDQVLGWFACNKDASSKNSVTVSFVSITDNLTNAGIYIYIPSSKTVIQVGNLTSCKIPAGANIKVIVFAQKADKNLFYFYKELTLGQNNETVDVTLNPITDAELTAKLDSL